MLRETCLHLPCSLWEWWLESYVLLVHSITLAMQDSGSSAAGYSRTRRSERSSRSQARQVREGNRYAVWLRSFSDPQSIYISIWAVILLWCLLLRVLSLVHLKSTHGICLPCNSGACNAEHERCVALVLLLPSLWFPSFMLCVARSWIARQADTMGWFQMHKG